MADSSNSNTPTPVVEVAVPEQEITEENTAPDTVPPAPETQVVVEEVAPVAPAPTPETPVPAAPVAPTIVVQPQVVTVTGQTTKVDLMISTIKDTMEQYLNAMAPGKPMPAKTGAANQYTLYRLFNNVCNMVEGFDPCWNELLNIFNEHKGGALAERYVFRFAEELPGTKEDHSAFFRLLNLLIVTADPATRKESLKQVSIYKTTQDGFTETARNNINQFYK